MVKVMIMLSKIQHARPNYYDPTDTFHQFYPTAKDVPSHNKDFDTYTGPISNNAYIPQGQFNADVDAGTLPAVSFIKFLGVFTEHPSNSIPNGEARVDAVLQKILASPTYSQKTLVLLTWDEYGGFADHMGRLPYSSADGHDTGRRTTLMALGHFARPNYVSHVNRDHSSILRFLEWNFIGPTQVGALQTRDANPDGWTNNIGDMLVNTLVTVPSN
jgi:phospholipase C